MILRLDGFRGLWQARGDSDVPEGCAFDAHDVSTRLGALAAAPGFEAFLPPIRGDDGAYRPIGTLARLFRREKGDEIFVACTLDGVFTCDGPDGGWICRLSGPLFCDRWDCVAYETGGVDVLILTNAQDGMIALYGDDLRVERKQTPARFAVLGRHAERIFGAGVDGEPDSLYYSRPYDPFDWSADEQNPEMGGGVIRQPSWDGDRFVALQPLGAYLLALKTRSIYQLRGADPSSFVITPEYGADAPDAPDTVAVDGAAMFYLSGGEIAVYDGVCARLLAKDALCETLRGASFHNACAVQHGHVYYLALALDGSSYNDAVIEYDILRETFMLRRGVCVRAFLEGADGVYFTSSLDPCRVYRYGAGYGRDGLPASFAWTTGWLGGDSQRKRKDGFVIRFFAEGADGLCLRLAVQTERGRLERAVTLRPEGRAYRLRFPLRGVRFRLCLYGEDNRPWRIPGGLEVHTDDENLG